MRTSAKPKHPLSVEASKLHIVQTMAQLQKVRLDIAIVNEKLDELYSTMRMIFEHHPDDKDFHFQLVDTDRFNRVTEKTGFEELINELEDHIQELRQTEEQLQYELMSLAS